MKSLQQCTPTSGFLQVAWPVFLSANVRHVACFLVQAKITSFPFFTLLHSFISDNFPPTLIFSSLPNSLFRGKALVKEKLIRPIS